MFKLKGVIKVPVRLLGAIRRTAMELASVELPVLIAPKGNFQWRKAQFVDGWGGNAWDAQKAYDASGEN